MGVLDKIDHIGIAVPSLQEGLAVYRDRLGMELAGIETVEEQKVRVAILKVGGTRIELLEATADDSPIAKFLSGGGRGVHHIAYRVADLDEALRRCEANGLKAIPGTRRSGAGGTQVVFLHPKSTVGLLTELTTGMADGE
jgi:methylmalonyl-CoA/ethylmalonyl-CoA epimerase